jgi:hypothetical protein
MSSLNPAIPTMALVAESLPILRARHNGRASAIFILARRKVHTERHEHHPPLRRR